METNHYKLDDDYFDTNKRFEKYIAKMGHNFKKYPRIYKLGILKRAAFCIKNVKYEEAYKMIRENFNVEQIKRFFLGAKYKLNNDKDSLFHHEKLGMDSPEE